MKLLLIAFFYVLKAIGYNDFVGKTPLPATPTFLLLIFNPILYAISNRAHVGIKPNAIYAADSNISTVSYLITLNI
jgi:hypothetical protein